MNPNQLRVSLYGPEGVISCRQCESNDTVGVIHREGKTPFDMCMDCFFESVAHRVNVPVVFNGPEAKDVATQFQDIRLQYECDSCVL